MHVSVAIHVILADIEQYGHVKTRAIKHFQLKAGKLKHNQISRCIQHFETRHTNITGGHAADTHRRCDMLNPCRDRALAIGARHADHRYLTLSQKLCHVGSDLPTGRPG